MKEEDGKKTDGRLWSLDALRGFDMLFITGLSALLVDSCVALGFGKECWLAVQMRHVAWHGFRIMDMIFPLFLFIAGVSFPYSHAKQLERGRSVGQIVRKVLFRGLALFGLGLVFQNLLAFDFAHLRVWSVLGRIGLAWMCAAFLYMAFRTRARLAIAAGLLAGVWAVMRFVPAPDAASAVYPDSLKLLAALGNGPFTPAGDFGCWLDRTLTAGHTYQPLFDPEGFSGFLPAVVTAMLGMFAGSLVKNGAFSGNRKALVMAGTGAALALAGWACSATGICPVNKALWSPAFVLLVGGYSFLVFSLFYWVIDVKGFRRWTFYFRVVGMNSITIYLAQRIVPFRTVRDFFFKGFVGLFPDPWSAVVNDAAYMAVLWLFLYFLYRKNTFLRV